MNLKRIFVLICVGGMSASAFSGSVIQKPVWAGNRLGKKALGPDYVDPNFSPIMVSGNTVMSGFKRMTLDECGLPQSSLWRDSKILKSPVRVILKNSQGAMPLKRISFELKKNGENSALGKAVSTAGGAKLEVSSKFDFDFTITYTIKLSPLKGQKPVIDKFSLIFPVNVKPQDEKLLLYYTEGPNRLEAGAEAQKRRVHLTLKSGDLREVAPGFCSIFWVGNTNYGLSWNFESAKGWNPVKGNELVFNPKTGEFSMNIIEKPTVLKNVLTYKFYLTPTPIKTMPKNWRAWNYTWRGSPKQKIDRKLFNELIYWSSTWRFDGGGFNSLWIRNPDKLKEVAATDKGMHKANYYIPQLCTPVVTWKDKAGKTYVLQDKYLEELCKKYHRVPGMNGRNLDIPDDAVRFNNISELNREQRAGKKLSGQVSTWDVIYAPELADHMVYGLNSFINGYGIGGIYYDGINPLRDFSKRVVWTDQDGKLRPFFHFSDQRALLKRMRCLVKNNDPNEVVVAHQSGIRPPATLSLCDAIIPGETFFYWYHEPAVRDASPNGDFYYAHVVGDIDNLKGEFFYRQWGLPHILLPEVRGKNGRVFPKAARGTRTMLAYTIHFDMLYFPTMCDVNEIYKWYKIRNEYGMADTNMDIIEFVPYWENKAFTANNKNVKISYYDKVKQQELYTSYDIRKKYMVMVSNLQFGDCKFMIKLPKGLKKVKVREMQTNKILPVKDGKINYSLIAYDFAIFEVTGELDDNRGTW